MQVTRRGTRIWGRPVLTRKSASSAVESLLYAVREGVLAYEDALRGEYIVAPINWLDWSKGLDPETTAEIIDWLALFRLERRAFIGIDPDDIDRLAAAAVQAVKTDDPSILLNETRTTGGALWHR